MEYTIGYKFRLYPTKDQIKLIKRNIGAARYVFNLFLAYRRNLYDMHRKSVSKYDTFKLLTLVKNKEPDRAWLKDADIKALRYSLADLDRAYRNFFEKRAKYPRFKSRHHHKQTYSTDGCVRIVGGKIRLPKLGLVRFVQSRELIEGRIIKATVTHTASDKYFVSLVVKGAMAQRPNEGGSLGIDVGIKSFCVDSKGNVVNNPCVLKKQTKKLKNAQRSFCRKKIGSRNREKQRIKLARVHEHIVNIRLDFLHKLTTRLCRENQTIAVESLNIRGLLKNHKLARAISDVSWGEFFRQLRYKAEFYGSKILRVPTTYPSSQTCSECGYKNPLVKDLKVREWVCPKCGAQHDRDLNAAINILIKATVGHTGSYACGERVRRSQGAVFNEARIPKTWGMPTASNRAVR